MYFKKSDIKDVKNYITKHANAIKVMIGTADEERFNQTINNILEAHQYKEGEKIVPEHMEALKADLNIAISNLSGYLVKNSGVLKEIMDLSEPTDYLATAIDGFYIKAMEKLGCPDMPLFHFDENIKKIVEESAMKIHRSFVSYDISKDVTIEQQRGKNADVLSKDLSRNMKGIKEGRKAESVGKMIAEYQALKARQSNHGFFWRMFHSDENKARNDLIKQMNKLIKSVLPDGMKRINLDNADPAAISREIADAQIKMNANSIAAKRFDPKTSSQVFGRSPVDKDIEEKNKISIESNQKEQMSKDMNFVNDVMGVNDAKTNNVAKSDAVKNDKVVVKDGDEVGLSN